MKQGINLASLFRFEGNGSLKDRLITALIILVVALGFSWLSDSLSGVSKGTQLVAGLLFLILLALWRISDQLK